MATSPIILPTPTGQTVRLSFFDPFWYLEQEVTRYTALHNSGNMPTSDLVEQGWEVRGIYTSFYTGVLETFQIALEEKTQIESLDYAYIPAQGSLITQLRMTLDSLTV